MNSISALAVIEGAEQTKKMIQSISEILKYNLKKLNENVTLHEEFKIVESYLYIQKARFGNRIRYNVDFDEDVMNYSVPSMILQPFVENAIIHGLEPKEEEGLLEVSIRDKVDDILILVKDNGLGMTEEKLREIFSRESEIRQGPRGGIGVSNVVRRLEIKYGKNVVDIKSAPGKGTEVTIVLPKAV